MGFQPRVIMKLEKDTRLWLVENLKFGQDQRPVFVAEGKLESVVNSPIISVRDRGLYELGTSAFRAERDASLCALKVQERRLIEIDALSEEHLRAWEALMHRVASIGDLPHGWARANFQCDEFQCKCCEKEHMKARFIERLCLARMIADVSFNISSGWRCLAHNQEVGGKKDSAHPKGLAADVLTPTSSGRFKILHGLMAAGFNRIGIAKDFIHVDTDPDKEQGIIFLY